MFSIRILLNLSRSISSLSPSVPRVPQRHPPLRGFSAARWAHVFSKGVSQKRLKRCPHARPETVADYWASNRHYTTHANSNGDFVPKHFGEHCARQVSQKKLKRKMQVLVRPTSLTQSLSGALLAPARPRHPHTGRGSINQGFRSVRCAGCVCKRGQSWGTARHSLAQPSPAYPNPAQTNPPCMWNMSRQY